MNAARKVASLPVQQKFATAALSREDGGTLRGGSKFKVQCSTIRIVYELRRRKP
jgi:hypothetical protein